MDDVLLRAPERTRFPTVNVVLFAATAVTTLLSGYVLAQTAGQAAPTRGQWFVEVVRGGLPFAASLLGILFAHEMGHYLMARRYRVDATLPFFIPFLPWGMWNIGLLGTLGAVIRIRSRMPSRQAVLDIGAAGPIAGFVVAVPLLLWGYAHSPVIPAGAASATPSLVGLAWQYFHGGLAAEPATGQGVLVFGRSLVTSAALHLTHPGLPAGADIAEHPVAIAAWFGLLVTALNLVPIGQLDGGHVTYALLGRERAARLSRLLSWVLLALALTVSTSWLLWFIVTRLLVRTGHPPAIDESPLTPGRRALAIASLALFVLTFMPVPISEGFLR